jgi:hypothetical protein
LHGKNVPGLQRVDGRAGPLPEFMTLLKKLGYSFDLKVVPALRFDDLARKELGRESFERL